MEKRLVIVSIFLNLRWRNLSRKAKENYKHQKITKYQSMLYFNGILNKF